MDILLIFIGLSILIGVGFVIGASWMYCKLKKEHTEENERLFRVLKYERMTPKNRDEYAQMMRECIVARFCAITQDPACIRASRNRAPFMYEGTHYPLSHMLYMIERAGYDFKLIRNSDGEECFTWLKK